MAKKITIESLATMVQKGFNGVDTKLDGMATTERIDNLEKWATGRFDKIEKLFIAEDRKRLEKLEMRVDYLENALAMPNKK